MTSYTGRWSCSGGSGSMSRSAGKRQIARGPSGRARLDGIGESVLTFTPLTAEAHDWIDEHVASEGWQWLGGKLCVEHRCAGQLIEGAANDGLRVRVL